MVEDATLQSNDEAMHSENECEVPSKDIFRFLQLPRELRDLVPHHFPQTHLQ
jgi:hypothetical protein